MGDLHVHLGTIDKGSLKINQSVNLEIDIIRRNYARADSIPRIQNGLGLAKVSTSKGIMTDSDARNKNIGGEIICRVF